MLFLNEIQHTDNKQQQQQQKHIILCLIKFSNENDDKRFIRFNNDNNVLISVYIVKRCLFLFKFKNLHFSYNTK